MTDRELLELIASQVGTLTNDMQEVKDKVGNLETKVGNLESNVGNLGNKVGNLENRMINMENENQKNFAALFDGYKQNTEQLNRIEKEVSKHEEIILRRIK